jgi:predicted amidohydrolase
VHIAAVQLDIAWHDRPANHRRVRQLIESAGVPRDALVVLPEMFDIGFSMDTAATDPGNPSVSEAFCRQLAIDHHVAVLAGVVARAENGKLANEAVAFDPDGRELVRYRKQQPWTPPGEHVHYPAGNGHQIFEWGGVKIAPFVCYDLRFPELFRPAAAARAELICVVASWPHTRSEHWVRLLQARAIENLAYVLGVNRCGDDPTLHYVGRSALFDPQGKPLWEADAREQVWIGEINAKNARDWRDQFPALRDMKADWRH